VPPAFNSAMMLHSAQLVRPSNAAVATPVPAATPAAAPAPVVHTAPVMYTMQRSASVATVNPAMLQFRNPIFGRWPVVAPQPRASFSLPTLISPDSPPVDTTTFEEPQNASLTHYLPIYSIATQGSGGTMVKWVSFAPSAQGFILTVHLVAAGPTRSGTAIEPTTRYMLTALDGGQNVSWDFGSVVPDGQTLTLTLTVTAITDRDSIYRCMTTPAANCKVILRRSFAIATLVPPTPTAPGPLYQAGTPAIDTVIPFTFDLNLDRNVFSQLSGVSSGLAGLNPYHLSWQQRSYTYYQDPNQPAQIYFLPDGFKISRRATAPHAPSISIASSGSDPSAQVYTLSFLAVPVWDPNRLIDAAKNLANQLALGTAPSLTPYEAVNTNLGLNLPAADSTVSGLVPVSGATIDIGAGVSASVTLSLLQLQQVYSALFDDVSMLLSGVVTVTVGQGASADVVKLPLSARASDFSGNLFTVVSQLDTVYHRLAQTLTNAIESPIQVQGLSGVLVGGDGTPVPSVAQQAWPAFPITLPPSAAATAATSVPATSDADASQSGAGAGSAANDPSAASTVAAVGAVASQAVASQAVSPPGSQGGDIFSVFGGILSGLGVQTGPTAGPQPTTPANGIAFAIAVDAKTAIDSTCSVLYDYGNVHVQPDADAIWDAIMQNQVLSPLVRNVRIMVFGSAFAAQPAPVSDPAATGASTPPPAGTQLRAIQVIFENGQTADFDASTPATGGILSQTVALTIPVKSYVLHEGDTSTYRYRVNAIRDSGSQLSDWISSNQDSFYAEVSA
jgi:hypothetical protein